ncbi:hypothetical protein BDZ89DRAFT_166822 [Hymenopellis radicata]|nr:hypothetical protein BDZ89DRAFT_166822 [Hymenopellis radicata]
MPKVKFFAVAVGREGPKIYDTWTECEKNVKRYPGAKHKSFPTRREAQEWLDVQALRGSIPRRGPPPSAPKRTPPTGGAKTEPPSTKDSTEIILSPEQQDVLRRVSSGQNVFFTGSAGTGKSILLNEIIKTLRNSGKTTAVTASTGIASVNLKGTTLHSWAGIQLGNDDIKKYVGKFLGRPNSPATKRWRETNALIIDESMCLQSKNHN